MDNRCITSPPSLSCSGYEVRDSDGLLTRETACKKLSQLAFIPVQYYGYRTLTINIVVGPLSPPTVSTN